MILGVEWVIISWFCLVVLARAAPDGECKSLWERVELQNAMTLPDGSAWDPEEGTVYPKGAHWKHETENGTSVIYGCPCRLGKPCLRKCCDKDQAMDDKTLECIPYDEARPWFRPNVSIDVEGNVVQIAHDHFALTYGVFCKNIVLGEPKDYPDDKYYLSLKDGALNLFKREVILKADKFCLEYFPDIDEYIPIWCYGTGRKKPLVVQRGLCYRVRYAVYPVAFSLSVFFLLVSLIVHCWLPELRNMHGKCLICCMVSLLVAYTASAAIQGLGNRFDTGTCVTFGVLAYWALFCTFLWLNILCIDMFLAFRGMLPTRRNSTQRKKFYAYMAYAWGIPFIMLLIVLFLEFYPHLPEWVLRPKFQGNCWITEGSKLEYFVIPMGIIVSSNLLLFLLTACTISRAEKETQVLTKGDSRRHQQREDKARFKLYIKLSLIMGISWISEVIYFAIGGSDCYWFLPDAVNLLQGVFIFLITTCKSSVKELIRKRIHSIMNRERGSFLQSISSSGHTTKSSI